MHYSKVTKYIILHDTVICGTSGMDIEGKRYPQQGLIKAINEFLDKQKKWKIKKHYLNNNGLMILKNYE